MVSSMFVSSDSRPAASRDFGIMDPAVRGTLHDSAQTDRRATFVTELTAQCPDVRLRVGQLPTLNRAKHPPAAMVAPPPRDSAGCRTVQTSPAAAHKHR